MSPASLLLLSITAIALTPPQRRPPKPPQKPPASKQRRPNNQVPRAQKPKVTDGLAQLRSDAQAGRWREALATITTAEGAIEQARDAGATFFPLPVEAYNLAITACGNGRNHEEALGVLRRLTMGVSPEEGPGSMQAAKRPRPDAVTFNAAAAACAKAGDYQKAEQVLKQARRFNKLDAILYTSVISACGRVGETKKALSYLEALREDLGRGDVVAYTAAVDACARAGDWRNAERVLGQMIFEDKVVPNLRTYRAACKAAAAAGEFAKCEELLDDVKDGVGIKVQAPFNSWSLAVGVRCCSLDTVEWISRRSCPSLGLSEGRGAEIT